jgi:hypothetical protein
LYATLFYFFSQYAREASAFFHSQNFFPFFFTVCPKRSFRSTSRSISKLSKASSFSDHLHIYSGNLFQIMEQNQNKTYNVTIAKSATFDEMQDAIWQMGPRIPTWRWSSWPMA